MPVYDESQESGIVVSPGLPGFSATTPVGGQPTTNTGSTLALNDLVDVDTAGGRAYQVLFRRTDGTYALKTLGYGTIGGTFPTSGDLIAAYPSGNGVVSYVVGDNLWVWDSTQWIDVGTFRGEPGVNGVDGQDGSGITVKGTSTWAAIGLLSPAQGDLWILSASQTGVGVAGDGLVWDGSQWTNAGPIRGPQGIQGIQGIQGDQGIQGIQGVKGDTGNQGIQGVKGDKGDTGNQGIQGIQGIQGLKGDTGDTGATGAASTVQGPQGIPGTAGADGNTILYGNTNPSNGTGVNGNFYINTATNFLFGPKAAGTWPSGVSLVGPQGIQGIQGIQGTTGSQGIQGVAGINGTNGIDGKTLRYGAGAPSNGLGVDGEFYINTTTNFIYGPKATTWPAGVSLVGPQGIQGIQGVQGNQGIQGVKGDTGDAGIQGIQGIQGVKGDTGDTGSQGIQGIQGVKGDTGNQGIQGVAGTNGTNGTNGAVTAQFGGIGTLSSKTYDARLPMPDAFTITRVIYTGVAGSNSFNIQLVKDGTNFGAPMTVTAGVTYQAFTVSLAGTAGSTIQIAAASVTGTAPTKVTFRLDWTTP